MSEKHPVVSNSYILHVIHCIRTVAWYDYAHNSVNVVWLVEFRVPLRICFLVDRMDYYYKLSIASTQIHFFLSLCFCNHCHCYFWEINLHWYVFLDSKFYRYHFEQINSTKQQISANLKTKYSFGLFSTIVRKTIDSYQSFHIAQSWVLNKYTLGDCNICSKHTEASFNLKDDCILVVRNFRSSRILPVFVKRYDWLISFNGYLNK